uniref:methylated-DNA--[protein]-cysteine S-methyltransferase n=1 Tax=uncultured Sphingomonas sp. TaxID=158754 RepID=UPI0035C99B87
MYARDTARIATPVGMVAIFGDESVVTAIDLGVDGGEIAGSDQPVRAAADQMRAWFAGALTEFNLLLAPAVTPRGQVLRDAMVAIPYGETLSYGALARLAGSSPRAIGQACARNSFPIIVPCHRVVNAAGSLGAYSAGEGPVTKRWLLAFEQRAGGRGLLL